MSKDLPDLPTADQQRLWWNRWDSEFLRTLHPEKVRQGDTALALLRSLNLHDPQILEVGCANGWLCERLIDFGTVTGMDIADEAVADARSRVPKATFFADDFCSAELRAGLFDVAITLGTLAHVPDQPGFIRNLAVALKPGGHLILLTQNRLVYSRRSDVAPQGCGQIRRWVTMAELRALVAPHFRVVRTFTIQPSGDLGFLRVVNSAKLNAALSSVISTHTLESFKERVGLGQTLVMLAERR